MVFGGLHPLFNYRDARSCVLSEMKNHKRCRPFEVFRFAQDKLRERHLLYFVQSKVIYLHVKYRQAENLRQELDDDHERVDVAGGVDGEHRRLHEHHAVPIARKTDGHVVLAGGG